MKLKLEEKPARLLACLIENRGKLLTREELRRRLWDSDVNLDFDHGLNKAANKLRTVLGDKADEPKYLETLSRRGYRFVGQVEFVPLPQDFKAEFPETTKGTTEVELRRSFVGRSLAEAHSTEPNRNQPRGLRLVFTVISALALAGILVVLLGSSRQASLRLRAVNFRAITRSGTEKTPFSTDGERIYFFEMRADKTLFTQISVNGGEELQLPATASVLPYQADVLGDELVYLDGNWDDEWNDTGVRVWIRQLPSGTAWQVPDVRCQSVSWSHDGHLLCVLGGEFTIINLQGRVVRKLFKAPMSCFRAHFSPDEKRVRFDPAVDGSHLKRSEIWEANADGSNLHPIAPELSDNCCGSWSNDGSLYVFEVWDGSRWDVWGLPENEGWLVRRAEPSPFTSGPLDARYPKVSADGRSVYFMGADFRGELSSVDEKAGRLVPFLGGRSITEVDFSPDREWITYVDYPEGTLFRSRRDGSDALQLTRPPILPFQPRFSRDGKRILFRDIVGNYTLYAVPLDGGKVESLARAGRPCAPDASFPDMISFELVESCVTTSGTNALQGLDISTGKTWRIPESEERVGSALSPDGRFIAAFEQASGQLTYFDGKMRTWRRLPDRGANKNPGTLAWSPDNRYVYDRQDQVIRRVPVNGAQSQVITILPNSSTYLWWSAWMGVSPEGEVLVTRQAGLGDIYAFDLQKN